MNAWRFCFVARESIHFPEGKTGNILRGALGRMLRRAEPAVYARIFEPRAGASSPSGFGDSPRPFVFRAADVDGRTVRAGRRFHFDVNEFDTRNSVVDHFRTAFAELGREGLGSSRGRADLESAHQRCEQQPVEVPLTADGPTVTRLLVRFRTPTALKSGGGIAERPEFPILFGRARDRVSTIRGLYGEGPLEVDFRGLGDRAREVEMIRCDIRAIDIERRSGRTGEVHSIGGFAGEAEYEGDITEFVPVLRAAEWTGVGRHTVWGNGMIEITAL